MKLKNLTNVSILLISGLFLYSSVSVATTWTETRVYDAPVGAVGTKIPEGNGDNHSQLSASDGRNATLFVDNAHTHPVGNGFTDSQSGYSVRMNWTGHNWTTLGVAPSVNKPVAEGDQIWGRAWVYFPTGFPLNSSPKVIRIMAGGPGSVGADYVWGDGSGPPLALLTQGVSGGTRDYYIDPTGSHPSWGWVGGASDTAANFKMGQWNSLEMYVKFSSSKTVGKVRVWLNGNPLWDVTDNTIGSYGPEGNTPTFEVWSNWDTSPPSNANTWIDDIVFTTDPAVASVTDSRGNKMIGLGKSITPVPVPVPVPVPAPVCTCPCSCVKLQPLTSVAPQMQTTSQTAKEFVESYNDSK